MQINTTVLNVGMHDDRRKGRDDSLVHRCGCWEKKYLSLKIFAKFATPLQVTGDGFRDWHHTRFLNQQHATNNDCTIVHSIEISITHVTHIIYAVDVLRNCVLLQQNLVKYSKHS